MTTIPANRAADQLRAAGYATRFGMLHRKDDQSKSSLIISEPSTNRTLLTLEILDGEVDETTVKYYISEKAYDNERRQIHAPKRVD